MSVKSSLAVVQRVADLRALVKGWRAAGEPIALVPTMGALHAGHISLVEEGLKRGAKVIATIFVNPTQFAPHEDFSKYPRTLQADLDKLIAAGAAACFTPDVAEMYPDGFCTEVSLKGPALAGLEDAFRPMHFAGVATVVCKLLNQAQADIAIFGQKDYQQLKVITRMARDLDIPTEIIGAPTMRESDGLAMSSRNVYLSQQERVAALALYRALSDAAQSISAGGAIESAVAAAREAVAKAGFVIDYIEARRADDLAPAASLADGPLRILAAAKLGKTRLIDNVAVERARS